MKKLICILAGAALIGACEQKTEVVAPAAPTPEKKAEASTADMGQRPKKEALSVAVTPAVSTETKPDAAAMSTEAKTEALSTPNP